MAFADPQSIAYPTAGTKSHALVSRQGSLASKGGVTSEYVTSDGDYKFTISHQKTGAGKQARIRTLARLDRRIVATDPLTSVQDYRNTGVYLVIDRPEEGFTSSQILDQSNALAAWMTASAGAFILKLYGLES